MNCLQSIWNYVDGYADDHHLYYSHIDPIVLDTRYVYLMMSGQLISVYSGEQSPCTMQGEREDLITENVLTLVARTRTRNT